MAKKKLTEVLSYKTFLLSNPPEIVPISFYCKWLTRNLDFFTFSLGVPQSWKCIAALTLTS